MVLCKPVKTLELKLIELFYFGVKVELHSFLHVKAI